MKTIIQPSDKINKLLPTANDASEKYHLFRYCIHLPVENGILLLHGLTNQLIYLTREEYERIMLPSDLQEELLKSHYLLGNSCDDKELVDKARKYLALFSSKDTNHYTIMTTMDCNANCFYCYEHGRKKHTMSRATAGKVSQYILEHSNNSKIKLAWFGGEPLMNDEVIDIICENLRRNQKEFTSMMTTNGYLFDDEILHRAKEIWSLSRVQITLDGTREVYNRIKAYRPAVENPFGRVLENIGKLLSNSVQVSIRLNIDKHNYENVMELIDFLDKNIDSKTHCVAYPALLFDESPQSREDPVISQGRFAMYKNVMDRLETTHLFSYRDLQKSFKVNHCMADDDRSLVITADGKIGKCQHFSESELIGSLNEDSFDRLTVNSFKKRVYIPSQCDQCNLYAVCTKIQKCPDQHGCTETDRNLELDRYHRAMYHKFKKDG